MSKLVSIIVLTYRRFDTLEQTLASIAMQEYDNYEVIINDNGSDNFSREAVEAMVERTGLRRVSIGANKTNLGAIKSENIAIKRAAGDIIVRLDSDDTFVDSRVLGDIVTFFEDTGCLLATARRQGTRTHRIMPGDLDAEIFKTDDVDAQLIRTFFGSVVYSAVMYFSRELFERIGMFDESYYMLDDMTYVIKSLLHGIPVRLLDRVTINYGESGTSNSNQGLERFSPAWGREDLKMLYETTILPNLSRVDKPLVRNRIRLTYELICSEAKLPKVIWACLRHFPTGIMVALGKVLGVLWKDEGMEYRLLSGQLFHIKKKEQAK